MRIDFDDFVVIDGGKEINVFSLYGYDVNSSFNPELFDIAQKVDFSDYIKEEQAEIILQRGSLKITCELLSTRHISVHCNYTCDYFDADYCGELIDKLDFSQVVNVSTLRIDTMFRQITQAIETQFRVILFKDYNIL